MRYKIKTIRRFQVVGVKARTIMQHERESEDGKVGDLWFRLLDKGAMFLIPHKVNRMEYLTLYSGYESDSLGPVTAIAGQRVFAVDKIPEGLELFQFPGGRYLVFSAAGEMPECLARLWQEIGEFFAVNEEYHRALTTDFEVQRQDPSKVDVYIAID